MIEISIIVIVLAGGGWAVRRFVQRMRTPSELPDWDSPNGDDDWTASVRAPRRHGPQGRADAVALSEPDDENEALQ